MSRYETRTLQTMRRRLAAFGHRCPACASTAYELAERPALLVHHGPPFTLNAYLLLTDSACAPLAAVTCERCGHVSLFRPERLLLAPPRYEGNRPLDEIPGGTISERLGPPGST